jgi:hypothetical protein
MTTEFEDRLREQMRHATAEVRMHTPAALVRDARQDRRRQTMARATAAGVTAVAAATAAVVIVTTGATGAHRDAGIQTTAYVINHVDSALGTAASAHDIAYLHGTSGSVNQWLYNGPRGVLNKISSLSPQGQPRLEMGRTETSAGATATMVAYGSRTWWRMSTPVATPPSSPASCDQQIPVDLSAYTLPVLTANIHQALTCGQLKNEGTEHVNGVDAIKLVSVHTWTMSPASPGNKSGKTVTGTATTTLWVDPATYLPVRWKVVSDASGSHQAETLVSSDITWLSPTSANLALLTIQIPSGFKQVAPPR